MKPTPLTRDPVSDVNRLLGLGPSELYVVSVTKFVVLYLLTGGGYIVYWSYRNWATYKERVGADILPLVRAVLWPFFILDLFDKIQNGLELAGRQCRWHPEPRALLIMLMVMISTLFAMFFDSPDDAGVVFIANALLITVSVFLFVGAQRAINLLAADSLGCSNCSFSVSNVVWALIGVVSVVLLAFSVLVRTG
ncbi:MULTISPECIES: hypothetical protein [unclassified Pseudomonas]|uniref:hypothetical protein n=1 Tax=unclassified Pseudomonas TaxID=196821 RepID=UPI00385D2480